VSRSPSRHGQRGADQRGLRITPQVPGGPSGSRVVTVLRRGVSAGEARVSELTPAKMAEMMVGFRAASGFRMRVLGTRGPVKNSVPRDPSTGIARRTSACRCLRRGSSPCAKARSSACRSLVATARGARRDPPRGLGSLSGDVLVGRQALCGDRRENTQAKVSSPARSAPRFATPACPQ